MRDELRETQDRKLISSEKQETTKCPLCGMTFVPGEHKGCKGCPLHKQCGLICCPNCGYQMPKESKLADWVKRRLNRKRRDKRGLESSKDAPARQIGRS